ncbi:MAG: hypothetical protein H7A35_13720 [Planctomycetales bacterium]|nr:MAG: hypothetical protein H7A35_13720 [Planctomycetales bacterium]
MSAIIEREKLLGVVCQFGGRRRSTGGLLSAPASRYWGITPDATDETEDRERFDALIAVLRSRDLTAVRWWTMTRRWTPRMISASWCWCA